MNLAFINCTYETFTPGHSGAIATWLYEVCRAAEADGVLPLLITRDSAHPRRERANTIRLDYPPLPAGWVMSRLLGIQKRAAGWVRPRQEAWCARVADAIRRAGAEAWPLVLHNDMELAVSLRRRLPGAKILHLAHNNNGTTPRYRSRFGKAVDVAMAVSDFSARWNEQFYGLAAGSVKTLYNGVDVEAFRPRDEPVDRPPVINYVGKLDPNKGPDLLLKAALRLALRGHRFAVQVVGRRFYDRDDADEYGRELRRLGLRLEEAGVECRFTGWVDRPRLPEVLGAAQIHVTPSRWDEPFGLTTLEAMACGMAVIGSRTGGTAEVIEQAGFLFEREDDGQLADLLEPLVADRGLRAGWGRRARERAEQFSWRRTWETLRRLIQTVTPAAAAGSHVEPAPVVGVSSRSAAPVATAAGRVARSAPA